MSDPNLLVGRETGDDAAVYRLREDLALVQTVDYFPPIVDDPYHFGAISVANAVSDVYSMGGTPLLGLNLVSFPVDQPHHILVEILKGGYDKAAEAGLLLVGGHTVDDKEPKYGVAVTGLVHPGEYVTNAGARPGDVLVLTKPIGTGIITTAAKNDVASTGVLDEAIQLMQTLNAGASAAMTHVGVHACTDVTGFGLLGHLNSMMTASKASARVWWPEVPLIEGTLELAEKGVAPGGTHRNLQSLRAAVSWDDGLNDAARVVLSDAQTSGGLLIAVGREKLDALRRELAKHGVGTVAAVGEVTRGTAGTIEVEG